MDGLLLDSEPFWKEAEIRVFNSVGVPITSEMCDSTVGMRIEEVVKHWHKVYPWDTNKLNASIDNIIEDVIQNVIELIKDIGTPFDGVDYIIRFFKERNIKTAIASSSASSIIDAVLEKFKIRNEFDIVHSAEFEQFGKPNPAVYLNTAKQLHVAPQNCLAFEDSYNGLLAAKDAGMKVIVIPDKRMTNDTRLDLADIKLASLRTFETKHLEILNQS